MTQVRSTRHCATAPGNDPEAAPQQRLLRHIDNRLDDPGLSPGTAASALGWSLRQVHAVMRSTGTTFMVHLARRRLDRARGLLARGQFPVAEVAFACGFNSLSSFYRHYTAANGEPPAATRRHARLSHSVWTAAPASARDGKTAVPRPPSINSSTPEPTP